MLGRFLEVSVHTPDVRASLSFYESIGFVQATVGIATHTADVAWVIGVPFQGRGYAREAAGAMVDRLREGGVARVTAHIHPDNAPSQGVARALGLAPTTTVVDGEVRLEAR